MRKMVINSQSISELVTFYSRRGEIMVHLEPDSLPSIIREFLKVKTERMLVLYDLATIKNQYGKLLKFIEEFQGSLVLLSTCDPPLVLRSRFQEVEKIPHIFQNKGDGKVDTSSEELTIVKVLTQSPSIYPLWEQLHFSSLPRKDRILDIVSSLRK